jgi:X-domain of DnaJ-containing
MRDVTTTASTMMTDEAKADMEKEMNKKQSGSNYVSSPTSEKKSEVPSVTPSSEKTTPPATHDDNPSTTGSTSQIVQHGSTLSPAPSVTAADKDRERREAAQRKAEQREALRENEKARRKVMEQRVAMLTKKMIERLRPFVEAKDPGGSDDLESTAFAEKMKREVEDLKLESFGVEVFLVFDGHQSIIDCIIC